MEALLASTLTKFCQVASKLEVPRRVFALSCLLCNHSICAIIDTIQWEWL